MCFDETQPPFLPFHSSPCLTPTILPRVLSFSDPLSPSSAAPVEGQPPSSCILGEN